MEAVRSSRTSCTVVVTKPQRFGYEPVDIFYEDVRPRPDRVLVCAGEYLRKIGTNEVFEFNFREGGRLDLTPLAS